MTKKKKILLIVLAAVLVLAIGGSLIYYFCFRLPEQKQKEQLLQQVEDYYNQKVALFAEDNKTRTNTDVVFLGDSLTDGCDLARYYPDLNAVNRGIGGDTTLGLEKRLDVSAYALRPKVIVMLIGGNNMDTMFDNYENILLALQSHLPETKIITVSLTCMTGEWARKNQTAILNNQKIKILSKQYGCTYVDAYTPLCDPTTEELTASYTVDGAHLTDAGYQVLTGTLRPVIEELLTR